MSFASTEESRNLGSPVELYLFRFGTESDAVYGYTDAEQDIEFDGVLYQAMGGPNGGSIRRGAVSASGSLDKSRLAVTVPRDSDVAELFRIYPPGMVVTLTIRGGHLDDPDQEFLVIWVGRVVQGARGKTDAPEVELTCELANTSLRRTGLRRNYQLSCPHVLYGQGVGRCNADIVRATTTGTVASTTTATATLNPGWNGAFAPEKFIGGMLIWTTPSRTERRTILGVTGNTLRLAGPTSDLEVAASVTTALGCNHQTSDCRDLHLNIVNFGGQPFIPLKSPIATASFTGG